MKYNHTTKRPARLFTRGAIPAIAAFGAGACLLAAPAKAAVLTGTAAGLGLHVDIEALSGFSLLGLQAGPLAAAQVTSPDPTTHTATVASVNVSAILGSVTAHNNGLNAISSSASTNADGTLPTGLSTGSSTVKNLAVTVVPEVAFVTPSLISITSTTIGSTSTSSGQYGALVSTGTSVLEGLAISVAGISITIPVNPEPNTVLVLVGLGLGNAIETGLSIILNEQIATGDGTGATAITTNALHVTLNALSLGLVTGVSGDILVGQSKSSLTAIPEPSMLACSALAALGLLRRRRIS